MIARARPAPPAMTLDRTEVAGIAVFVAAAAVIVWVFRFS
jgi:hypothetical protein